MEPEDGLKAMQTPEEKERFDRLTAMVCEFTEIAGRLGVRYKVAGEPYRCKGREGTFQLKRHQGLWSVVWSEDGEEKRLHDSSLLVKRLFLQHALKFFNVYIAMAKEWESTVDDDLDAGARALAEVRRTAGVG